MVTWTLTEPNPFFGPRSKPLMLSDIFFGTVIKCQEAFSADQSQSLFLNSKIGSMGFVFLSELLYL